MRITTVLALVASTLSLAVNENIMHHHHFDKFCVENTLAESDARVKGTLNAVPLFGAGARHLSLPGRFPHGLNLITNPSFTSGFSGWSGTEYSYLSALAETYSGHSTDAAGFGSYCQGLDTIYQTLTTVSGTTYEIQFHYNNVNPSGYSSTVHVTFGSTTLLSFTNTAYPWTLSTSYVVAGTGTSTRFQIQACNDYSYFLITNIVVVAVSSTPTATRSAAAGSASPTRSPATASSSATSSVSQTPSHSPVSVTASPTPTHTVSPTKSSADLVNGGFPGSAAGWSGAGSQLYLTSYYTHSGHDVVEMGSTCNNMDTLTAEVTTVMGATYHISFWWANVDATPSVILVTFGGQTVLSEVNYLENYWTQTSINLVATSAPTTALTFSACNTNGWFLFTQVVVAMVPSASSSVTASRSPTSSVSATPVSLSVTPSLSFSATGTPVSQSASPSGTQTRSRSQPASATQSPTGTQSFSPSSSISQSPSASSSISQSPSSSVSQSSSASVSQSPSSSISQSPSSSISQSPSASSSVSQSSSASSSTSASVSGSQTSSRSSSASSSPSQTGSASETASETPSTTQSATATVTPSRSATPLSVTPTPSQSQVVVSLTLAPRLLGPDQTATLTATIVSGGEPTAPVEVYITHAGIGTMHADFELSSSFITIPAFHMSATMTVTCITTQPSVIVAFYSSYVVPGTFVEPYYLALNLTNEMPSTTTSATPTPVSKTASPSMSQSLSSSATRTLTRTPSNTYTLTLSNTRSSSASRTSSISTSAARSASRSRSPTNTPTNALVGFSVSTNSASSNSNITLTASLSTGPLPVPVELYFSISGTAVRGVDYLIPALFITIQPGTVSGALGLQVLSVGSACDVNIYVTAAAHATVDPASNQFFEISLLP